MALQPAFVVPDEKFWKVQVIFAECCSVWVCLMFSYGSIQIMFLFFWSMLHGIWEGSQFPGQGWNLCPLHWKVESSPLDLQGSPRLLVFFQQECYRSNAVSFSGHRIGRYIMLIHPFIGDINLDYLVKVVSPTKLLHCSYWDVIMEGFGREILSDCISNLWSIHSSSEV